VVARASVPAKYSLRTLLAGRDVRPTERRSQPMSATTAPIQSEANTTVPADAVVQEPPASPRIRLTSLDAYRGFVMLLMASEGLGIGEVAKEHGTSGVWQFLKFQVDHVQWIGCSLWDMIQPSFSFLVGVALVFSFAKRQAEGQSFKKMLGHAVVRSLALIALGIFLRSDGRKQTYFTFEDTLSQIGLGYTFLFHLARTKPKVQLAAALSLLVLYWAAFALYPLPQTGFDYNSVGVHGDWPHLQGFAAHWDKNTNFASGFDQWFLNRFPREKPFVFNGGGYLTLSFIPTLATMIFGLLAGGLLKSEKPGAEKVRILLITGMACLIVGWMLGVLGICPVVKRIWTPSWTIYSAGWCCLLMASFYGIIDIKGKRKWAFPLVVVGMNSITMYVMADLFRGLFERSLKTNLGQNVFQNLGGSYAPILEASTVLLIMWLICLWMYRRKLFLRI
jgi:heparan-alpha-glucosaminide N-acetyltransferase